MGILKSHLPFPILYELSILYRYLLIVAFIEKLNNLKIVSVDPTNTETRTGVISPVFPGGLCVKFPFLSFAQTVM